MSPLEITEVSVHVCRTREPGSPLLGFARIVLNGAFVVNGIRILQAKNESVFIAFPREQSKREGGKPHNICYPILREFHDEVIIRILTEYQTKMGEPAPAAAPRTPKEY